MKITDVETLHCDAGWRPWTFVVVRTDEGITGYGECTDNRNPLAIAGCVEDIKYLLVDRDPRPVEMIYSDLYRRCIQSPGGIAQKAIAGIDCALWDIKGKALGVPVYELLGGPTRDVVRLYWSHIGTYQARWPELVGASPVRTMNDIADLGKEAVSRGYTAIKTNVVFPGDPASTLQQGFGGGYGTTDKPVTRALTRHIEVLIGTFRDAVGDDVDIALDLNFNFTTEGFIRVARAVEPFDLMWLEVETYDPQALLQIKQSTSTHICSGENLYTGRGYRPFLELHAMDIVMVDVPWNGFTVSKKVADMVESYEMNIAPHNYYSHLATYIGAHLCACVPNVRIMETDVADVPWKDDIVTVVPEVNNGDLKVPTEPGWGTDLNEREIAKHVWSH